MKSARDIKMLAESLRVTPSLETDRRVLDAAEAALEQNVATKTTKSIPLWRRIMASRPSRFAVAAVVFIVIVLSIMFPSISPDGATVAWAEMIEAMKLQRWIYMYSDNGHNISQWWMCPEEKITIHDYNGDVEFVDYKTNRTRYYDKQTNVIEIKKTIDRPDRVSFDDSKKIEQIFNRPYEDFERFRKLLGNGRYQPVISNGQYRGHDVQIQTYVSGDQALNKNEDGSWLVLFIDTQTSLLRGRVEWCHSYGGADPNKLTYTGVERSETAYDYPDPGPQTIYDVGVPEDAKVIKRYDETFLDVLQEYQEYQSKGLNKIACILTWYNIGLPNAVMFAERHNDPNGPISKLKEPLGPVAEHFDVFYFDHKKYHRARYFNLKENISGSKNMILNWPKCRAELGNSYDSFLAWIKAHENETRSSMHVSDGRYEYRLSENDGKYRFRKSRSAQWESSRYGELGQRTWPRLDVRSKLFADDYSKQHGLIGVKYTQYPDNSDKVDVFMYYLNPQKDYLCHKEVAIWATGTQQVHEVETYQQVNGKWYPKRVNYGYKMPGQERLRFDECSVLFVDESPDFTDDVFSVGRIEQLYKSLQGGQADE